MKLGLSKFHLLCFVSMAFSHSIYFLPREIILLLIYEPLNLNKQLFVVVFSIFLSILISPDERRASE